MVVRKILETTLTAGQTSVHFTDSDIPLSLIRVYTSDPDLLPIERTLSGNTVTVYFEAQSSNVGVALEIVKAGLDIIDDLTSTDATAALSAKQGKVLKDAIDAINIPTDAYEISYDNTGSGLTADNVQSAIDEVLTDSVISVSCTENTIDFTQGDNTETITVIDPSRAKADIVANINAAEGSTIPNIAIDEYAIGDHFMQKGKFCTAIAAISIGDTLTKNINYIEEKISDYITVKEYTASSLQSWLTFAYGDNKVKRTGNVVEFNLRFTISGMGTLSNTLDCIEFPFRHSDTIPCMFNLYVNDATQGYPLSNVVPFIGSSGFRIRMVKGSTLADGSYYLTGSYLTKNSF